MYSVLGETFINLKYKHMSNFNYDAEERYYARLVEESANDKDEQPREPNEDELENMSTYQRLKWLKIS